jgi:DNA-binding NtrC family response regulator
LSIDPLGPTVLEALERPPWPGNIRELEKVLKQAMIFRREGALEPDDVRRHSAPQHAGLIAARPAPAERAVLGRLPLSSRREVALRIVGDCGGVTRRDLARECSISGEVARQELSALTRLGFLRRVGRGRSTLYVRR